MLRWFIRTVRPTTRFWFDVVVPLAMLVSMGGRGVSPSQAALVVAGVLLWHAGQTFFNDLVDVRVDRASADPSRNTRALVTGAAPPRRYLIAGWVSTALAILISIPLGWMSLAAMTLVLLPAGLLYNFRGFSGRPKLLPFGWPLIWSGIYAYAAGALDFAGWTRGLPYLAFVVVFMGMGEGLTQDIRDWQNDRDGGRRTTVVHFGVPLSSRVACAYFALSLAPWCVLFVKGEVPLLPVALGGVVLVAWLAMAVRASLGLQREFHPPDARLLHVGAIWAFTLVNATFIVGRLWLS